MYQELLLTYARSPRYKRRLGESEIQVEKKNPNCGDELAFTWRITEGGILSDWHWDGQGCAISLASASILCELLESLSAVEVQHRVSSVLTYLSGDAERADSWGGDLLPALGAVRTHPMRLSCATLAWEAVAEALASEPTL